MLLRLSGAAGDLYPDEIAPLLDTVFASAESSSKRERLIAIACSRAKRAWLLERTELAREELGRAKLWIRPDDAVEVHASLCLCEAGVALVVGSNFEDDVALPLARAGELFRGAAPRQAAVAGRMLGEFWRRRGRSELAIAAYQIAAEDARRAGDLAQLAEAELGELGAAVDGGVEHEDALDRLRALSEQFRLADHVQHEGTARADFGRCLLRRGLRDAAVIELERARACFAATMDAASELSVGRLLDAAR